MQQLSLIQRRFLLPLLVLGLVLTVLPRAAAQGPRLWLDPAVLELSPGDEGTVAIHVSNVTAMAGAEVHLTFDPVILEVLDADPGADGVQIAHGDFLSPDFVAQNTVDMSAGTVDYAIACMPADKAVSGDGVLARLSVRALSTGKTQLVVRSVILADKQGVPIDVETESGIVTVRRMGPTPMVWALIGLIAVAVAAGVIAVVWSSLKSHQS
ncbi:MAG TPA: hypothetical protein ENK17_03935 [Anaerolineae bacterium]|nr:hypothetical protein [Anaerolineae bacterium]